MIAVLSRKQMHPVLRRPMRGAVFSNSCSHYAWHYGEDVGSHYAWHCSEVVGCYKRAVSCTMSKECMHASQNADGYAFTHTGQKTCTWRRLSLYIHGPCSRSMCKHLSAARPVCACVYFTGSAYEHEYGSKACLCTSVSHRACVCTCIKSGPVCAHV